MCKEVVEVNLHKMNGIKSERENAEGHFPQRPTDLTLLLLSF